MKTKAVLLSSISGLLLFLSFPKFGSPWCVWIALVPLFYALNDSETSFEAILCGFLAGFIFNIGIIYWVIHVVVRYGDIPLCLAFFIMLLFAAYLALYVSLFSSSVVFLKKHGIDVFISAPFIWTTLEFVKAYFLTGFPWEGLAYSQWSILPVIQIADITGVYGITFLIVSVNAALFSLLVTRFSKRAVNEIMLTIFIITLAVFYGILRIDEVHTSMKHARSLDISLIQGNIDQSIKWNPNYQRETLNIYRDLSLDASEGREGKRFIIWPETAAPFFFQNEDEKHHEVISLAKSTRAHILFGAPRYEGVSGSRWLTNSAYLVSPNGNIAGRYDKVHLVPFGEYVPLRGLLFFVDKLVAEVGDFKPGQGFAPLAIDSDKIGVLICYEGIFPEISREYRIADAKLLVNLTNDAWYGRTSAPYQHLTMVKFRAVENRIYVVRAANTGISAIIAPDGAIEAQMGLFERGSINGTVKIMGGSTFYSRNGDVFAWCIIAFSGLLFLIALRIRRKGEATSC